MQLGSFETGPSIQGPRQTIQRDLFGRYDGSTPYRDYHTLRFGGAIHRITQGDFYAPGNFGPSVTSSNGIDVMTAINSNPTFPPLVPGDPKGAADNPLNYPVGTITIFNGLGNFSERSAFNRATGAHSDTRVELYAADTFKLYPNLSIFVGANYVRDTGRTNSDLASIPELALFGNVKGLGNSVNQPNWNFSPQAGVAWDPGRHGRTVIRAGGGMFFDNFLLQNAYQDRISRLSQGQYFRSLNLCPTGSVLFPDGSVVSSVDELNIATQICGQPIGNVATAIEDLQQQYLAAQSAVTSGPNLYSLSNSLANFGGMLAPNFRTPRTVHMSAGIQQQLGERSMFSIDYVREIGTQYPVGIDTNHVGDVSHLDPAAGLAAINATVMGVCPTAGSAGSESQAAVQCYINAVPGASIVDFARSGLDSSNAFCGPFPCSVVNLPRAAFGGINPSVGSNVMYFPSGRTKYVGVHAAFRTSGDRLARGIRHWDLAASYTYSKYESNVASPDGSGGDFSLLSRAREYINTPARHIPFPGLDRRNMFTIAPTFDLPRGPRLSIIAQFASPLELSDRLPQLDGGGVAGRDFSHGRPQHRSDGEQVPWHQTGRRRDVLR